MDYVLAIALVSATAMAVWLCANNEARERVLAAAGFSKRSTTSLLTHSTNRVAAFLILVALFVAINPEARLFLLFIDAIGLDAFLMLVILQLRDITGWAHRIGAPALVNTLLNWDPIPFSVPTQGSFRQHPLLSVCSMSSPIVPLCLLAGLSSLAFQIVNAMW